MDFEKQRFLHRQLLASSLLQFTTKMFAYTARREYVVGEHHKIICDALMDVIKGRTNKLIINISPRYGKTLLCSQMFIAYGLALNPASKFLHISYSGSLVQENSMAVKDTITSTYFQTLFPEVQIKKNDNTRAKWSTTAGGGEYATSTLGQITGFGAGQTEMIEEELKNIDDFTAQFNPDHFSGAIVIDDPLRPDDALSDNVRESINRRFETTIRNRVNSRKTPIIIIMQRLHEHDLCGYLQEIEPNEWTVVSLPVIKRDEDGTEHALWPFKHTLEELYKIRHASEFVFETQYMQNPTPMEGLMYHVFRTYDALPERRKARMLGNYTDSADTGFDFLC